jgi:hypothetical protein
MPSSTIVAGWFSSDVINFRLEHVIITSFASEAWILILGSHFLNSPRKSAVYKLKDDLRNGERSCVRFGRAVEAEGSRHYVL